MKVRIDYLRPPDRRTTYVQELLHDDNRTLVTLARDIDLPEPLRVAGATVLDRGSDALWFTFPGAWHDIGRFHRPDGTFTGIYANVITPCIFGAGGEWETTDLFLDVWLPAGGGEPRLLDEEELRGAERAGWIPPRLAARARSEAAELMDRAARGTWPPPVVAAWTRERALNP